MKFKKKKLSYSTIRPLCNAEYFKRDEPNLKLAYNTLKSINRKVYILVT